MDAPQELYDQDTGEFVGWGITDGDGSVIQFDDDGVVQAAWTEAGDEINIDRRLAYDWDSNRLRDLDVPTHQPSVEERAQAAVIAAVEQRFGQGPVIHATPVAIETDLDILHRRWDADTEILEAEYGRPLLIAERRKLAAEAFADLDRGGSGSLIDASTRLAWTGEQRTLNLDNDSDRAEFMAARLQEGGRAARAAEHGDDDLQSDREPWRGPQVFDANDDQQRQHAMELKLQGHEGIELAQFEPAGGGDEQ